MRLLVRTTLNATFIEHGRRRRCRTSIMAPGRL